MYSEKFISTTLEYFDQSSVRNLPEGQRAVKVMQLLDGNHWIENEASRAEIHAIDRLIQGVRGAKRRELIMSCQSSDELVEKAGIRNLLPELETIELSVEAAAKPNHQEKRSVSTSSDDVPKESSSTLGGVLGILAIIFVVPLFFSVVAYGLLSVDWTGEIAVAQQYGTPIDRIVVLLLTIAGGISNLSRAVLGVSDVDFLPILFGAIRVWWGLCLFGVAIGGVMIGYEALKKRLTSGEGNRRP